MARALDVIAGRGEVHRLGDDAAWDRAERQLADVVAELGLPCAIQPGAGAIYGPKLELLLRDRRGRSWQCGTIQLDFVMPQRFDVRYVDPSGNKRHVVMLHRALYGSIERFVGLLLEHHGAALPAWLAPEQIAILPISADHAAYAESVHARLAMHDVRSRIDREGTLARRVAVAQHDGVPFVVVVGDRELRDGTIAVRARDSQMIAPLVEGIASLVTRCTP